MDKIIPIIVLGLAALMAYLFFVFTPVLVWTQSKCLAAGYPETRVDVFLNGYCMTLDGAVQVPVVKASQLPKGTK